MWQQIANWLYIPKSEFFWPYIVSALIGTLFFLKVKHQLTIGQGWKKLFSRKIWLHRSTRLDFVISMFYAFIWYVPSGACFMWGFNQLYNPLQHNMTNFDLAGSAPEWLLRTVLTIWMMICIDLATYVIHRAMHTWQWLWALHSVHHATEHLNIFSTHRQHPAAPLILNLVRGAFAGAGYAIFNSLAGGQLSPFMLFSMSAGFFIYMLTINLHHLHIPISFPKFTRYIFISPHIHHIHHSMADRHINKNFGVVFSFWDRLFGTYYDEDLELDQLRFGIADDPYKHRLLHSLFLPITMMFKKPINNAEKMVRDVPKEVTKESAKILIYCFLLIVPVIESKAFANGVQKISITDEKCELSYPGISKGKNIFIRENVELPNPPKPFICTRTKNGLFSCFSTSKKKSYPFTLSFESSTRISLETNNGRYALIDVDIKAKRFQVASTFRNTKGRLITENCFGAAEIK